MNFKEFFKPTKGKIIAFLLIFLFVPLPVLVTKAPICPEIVGYICPNPPYWFLQPLAGLGLLFSIVGYIVNLALKHPRPCGIFGDWGYIGASENMWFPILLLHLVLSYIGATILVAIYHKFRK